MTAPIRSFVVRVIAILVVGLIPLGATVLQAMTVLATPARSPAMQAGIPMPQDGLVPLSLIRAFQAPDYVELNTPADVEIGTFGMERFHLAQGGRYRIGVVRWNIPSGGVVQRSAHGPSLVLIVRGTVLGLVNGDGDMWDPGDQFIAVPDQRVPNQRISLENMSDEEARVLVVWLERVSDTPSAAASSDSDIGSSSHSLGGPPFWEPFDAFEAEVVDTAVLSWAPPVSLPESDMQLFVGYLDWQRSGVEFSANAIPGPTGIFGVDEATINGNYDLGSGDCVLSPSGTDLAVEAEGGAEVMIFGVHPTDGSIIDQETDLALC